MKTVPLDGWPCAFAPLCTRSLQQFGSELWAAQGQGGRVGTGILGREQLLVRDVAPGLISTYSPSTPT